MHPRGSISVVKRDGTTCRFDAKEIERDIEEQMGDLDRNYISAEIVTTRVSMGICDGIHTRDINVLVAETCMYMCTRHPDYSLLAGRFATRGLYKSTNPLFSGAIKEMYEYKNPKRPQDKSSLISEKCYHTVMRNAARLDGEIISDNDMKYDYFSYKTLERSFLSRVGNRIIERPQYMLMRVAVGIHLDDIESVVETYRLLSEGMFIHASPSLFNAGTEDPQMSSCFLIGMEDDSIEGIYNTLKDCAMISKTAGGIGFTASKIRASGSYIRGTNGYANGLVPMLRVFSDTARYVDQCLDGDTIIYTTNRGPIKMSEVIIGDRILTKTGKSAQVSRILKEEKSECLKIKAMHSIEPLRVTKEHPLLVLREQKKGLDHNTIKTRLEKKLIKPMYVEAGELNTDDMILFAKPDHGVDIETIDGEDCRMYGLLIASGNFQATIVHISCDDRRKEITGFIEKYLGERMIQYHKEGTESPNNVRYHWSTVSVRFPFSREQLYDRGEQKFVHPIMMNLPVEKASKIVRGILDGSGHHDEKEITLEMTSRQVLESVRYILLRMGVLTSGIIHRDKIGNASSHENITATGQVYLLRVPRAKEAGYLSHGDYMFSRVESIEEDKFGEVKVMYDLVVESGASASYMTGAGVVHNGGGKRKGAFACYLEPWHADVFEFLDLRKNHGKEEMRARDLFLALWIPDLFMERVNADEDWSLFCPNEAPGLFEVHSAEFVELYERYEREGRAMRTVKARILWDKILESQTETGVPYLLYKDPANRKSNQSNLGTIQCSNLCTEIIEYTSLDESAVCNLASIALPKYVEWNEAKNCMIFNYEKLVSVVRVIVRNLNRIIDLNYYPLPKTRRSNMRHRPMGIGVQGLADTFCKMKIAFGSEESRDINKKIFETIYYAAVDESAELAMRDGPYSSFEGSPLSKGKFQFDLWREEGKHVVEQSGMYDWDSEREKVMKYGVRNSLLIALMPTASTAQLLRNNESIEPFTSNIYQRRVLSGEFPVINRHLVKELIELGLWTPRLINKLIAHRGSVQSIDEIPDEVKARYKIVWEMSQKILIDMAADRAPYICHSQSMNLFIAEPDDEKLTSMHFYSWSKGLKTGIYYLRTLPAANAIQFTVDQELLISGKEEEEEKKKGGVNNDEEVDDRNDRENDTSGENLFRRNFGSASVCRRKNVEDAADECFVCGS